MMRIKTLLSKFKKKIYKKTQPSLNDLDKKLEPYLNFKNGFFIEVGANDGYTQSNTYYLEKTLGWKGLLVEGIPELYKKCVKERPGSIVKNFALVSDDYQGDSVEMHYANLMSVVDGAMKTDVEQDEYIKLGKKVQNLDESYTISVPARTLESIIDEIGSPPRIDFFSLDVEGYELSVLKGLNMKKYRPAYILVECLFYEEVNDYLLSQQYEAVKKMSDLDYLYRRKEN